MATYEVIHAEPEYEYMSFMRQTTTLKANGDKAATLKFGDMYPEAVIFSGAKVA